MIALLAATLAAPAQDLATICTWTDARWEQGATLHVPGTGLAYGHARPADASVSGTLGTDPYGAVRFRARIEGEGVRAEGDIGGDDPLFTLLDEPIDAGGLGTVAPGAMVDVAGHGEQGARVVPYRWAFDTFRPYGSVAVDVPCERLGIHWHARPEDDALLTAAGFPADAPTRVLAGRRAVPVRREPGGPIAGRFPRSAHPRSVRVAGERDGWAHVARPHWTGVVWHGWVPSDRLAPPADDPSGGGGLGVLGALSGGLESPRVRRCDAPVALSARVGRHTFVVGELAAGVPIEVVADEGEALSVRLPTTWLSPVEGAALLVPGEVRDCPERALPAR